MGTATRGKVPYGTERQMMVSNREIEAAKKSYLHQEHKGILKEITGLNVR